MGVHAVSWRWAQAAPGQQVLSDGKPRAGSGLPLHSRDRCLGRCESWKAIPHLLQSREAVTPRGHTVEKVQAGLEL